MLGCPLNCTFERANPKYGKNSFPKKNALYHTVQMVLVDPCDKLIICFLWAYGINNYVYHPLKAIESK